MTRQIKVVVATGFANARHIDYWDLPEIWDELTNDEQEKLLDDCAQDFLNERCEGFACVVESNDE